MNYRTAISPTIRTDAVETLRHKGKKKGQTDKSKDAQEQEVLHEKGADTLARSDSKHRRRDWWVGGWEGFLVGEV